MKIRMITKSAGPAGNRAPGWEGVVPDAEAKDLLSGGYAVEIKEAPKKEEKKEPPAPVETAEDKGPRETAEAPEGRHSARPRR